MGKDLILSEEPSSERNGWQGSNLKSVPKLRSAVKESIRLLETSFFCTHWGISRQSLAWHSEELVCKHTPRQAIYR